MPRAAKTKRRATGAEGSRPRGRPRSTRTAPAAVSVESSAPVAETTAVSSGESISLPLEPTTRPVVFDTSAPTNSAASPPMVHSVMSVTTSSDIEGVDSTPLTSICDDLGLGVSQHIREKIWNGEFVDLALLLRPAISINNASDCVFSIGSRDSPAWQIRPHNQTPRITSVEQWTSAFLIFASIYLMRHPTRARQLLKYADIVRSAAFRRVGYGWRDYDIQFRLRQARMPSRSWASIDAELWLTLLGAPVQQPIFRPYNNQRSIGHTNIRTSRTAQRDQNAGVCFDFNRGHCFRPACRFPHKCATCLSVGHSAASCRSSPRSIRRTLSPTTPPNASKNK